MSVELTSKWVKVRKRHQCDWCNELIETGERARARSGVYQGVFYSCRQHPECWEAMMNSDMGYDDEYMPGEQERGKTMEESHA